ncbi:unnamed protein product [Acanthosepion pharaonis]|uniref:Uncharacterized protein n=1 Tax=Acanthosepion pharaonis TaxID=158019 RepID=A0A812C163_ACAPH|nr:unnamed protein product [Sepia pharaonis]
MPSLLHLFFNFFKVFNLLSNFFLCFFFIFRFLSSVSFLTFHFYAYLAFSIIFFLLTSSFFSLFSHCFLHFLSSCFHYIFFFSYVSSSPIVLPSLSVTLFSPFIPNPRSFLLYVSSFFFFFFFIWCSLSLMVFSTFFFISLSFSFYFSPFLLLPFHFTLFVLSFLTLIFIQTSVNYLIMLIRHSFVLCSFIRFIQSFPSFVPCFLIPLSLRFHSSLLLPPPFFTLLFLFTLFIRSFLLFIPHLSIYFIQFFLFRPFLLSLTLSFPMYHSILF